MSAYVIKTQSGQDVKVTLDPFRPAFRFACTGCHLSLDSALEKDVRDKATQHANACRATSA